MQSAGASPGVSTVAADPFQGTPYRTRMPLGAGGMGEVYLVEHEQLGREFVAKVLHARLASDKRLVDRMRVEAQSLGRLNHPHIVQITGFGTTRDGRPFLVMEWLRGHTLTSELATFGCLHAKEAIRLAGQLLSALAAAHAIGVVHRDIKPDNLFVCVDADGNKNLKILDFGVARVMPDAPDSAPNPLAVPTGTGVVVGTPRFVSPEAAMGQRVDSRADLYAAALVLYAMVAGRGPFDHLNGDQVLLTAHALEDPTPPSRYTDPPAPSLLDAIILRGLAKNPNDRFQGALEFKAELDRIADTLYRPVGWIETTSFDVATIGQQPVPADAESPVSAPAPVIEEVSADAPRASTDARIIASVSSPVSKPLVALVFVAAIALAALVAAGIVLLIKSRLG